MKQWYYVKKGRAQGPVTTDQLRELISLRQLGPFDLVFSEGDSQWAPLIERTEFSETLDSLAGKNRLADQWVCLRRKVDGSKGYDQIGPFSSHEVLRLIERGELSYFDYVWQEGMREWYRIGQVTSFQKAPPPRVEFNEEVPSLPMTQVLSPEDAALLRVVRRAPEANDDDRPPPEAIVPPALETKEASKGSKPDLEGEAKTDVISDCGEGDEDRPPLDAATVPIFALSQVGVVAEGKSPYRKAKKEKKRSSAQRQETFVDEVSRVARRSRRWLGRNVIGAALSLAIIAAASLLILTLTKRDFKTLSRAQRTDSGRQETAVDTKVDPAVQAPASSPPELSQKAVPAKVAPETVGEPETALAKPGVQESAPPEVQVPASQPATFVRVLLKDLEKRPVLVLNSDAGRNYFFEVRIAADGGEVLRLPSFYREIRLRAAPSVLLDLVKEGLPDGKYRMVVEVSGIKREKEFSIGEPSKELQSSLWRHRKALVREHQSEKWAIFRILDGWVSAVSQLQRVRGQWTETSTRNLMKKDWAQARKIYSHAILGKIGPRSASLYVHSRLWLEIKSVGQEVSLLLDRLGRGEDVQRELSASLQKISDLRSQVLDLTIY